MHCVVGLLLAFLTIEGLLLVLWPQHVRQMIEDAPPGVLRIAGAVELAIVLLIVLVLWHPF
jgi:uncharacterized protein YjeT (DUF2065 family)